MQILISDPVFQTNIFILAFILSLIFSARKRQELGFSSKVTEELKGFAILAIIFSHIGYFLVSDHRFLYPLSVLAGTGVNLFLFLSGFGLYKSWQKTDPSILGFYKRSFQNPLGFYKRSFQNPLGFYKKRIPKLFIPFLIVLTTFLILDRLVLNITYPLDLIIKNYFGFFPLAQIYEVINSPLWYFSLIFFYYIFAPFFFKLKNAFLAALALFSFTYLVFNLPLPIDKDVQNLYLVHFIAFPLGVAFCAFDQRFFTLVKKMQIIILPLAIALMAYTAIHSGVGEDKFKEQAISLVTMFSILIIFVLNRYQLKLFNLFGKYSYEIYLLHWPILLRYDIYYHTLPASMATVMYLTTFIILGFALQQLTTWIFKKVL